MSSTTAMNGDQVSGLCELVQQAEQLTAQMDTSVASAGGIGELPRVERNLRQLLEAGQQLWSRTAAQPGSGQQQQQQVGASILLGSRGVDLPAMSERLDALQTSAGDAFQPLQQSHDTDVAAFLRAQRENVILEAIESVKTATYDMVDRLHWQQFQSRWETDKQRLLSSLASVATAVDTDKSLIDKNTSMTTFSSVQQFSQTPAGVASTLTVEEMTYVTQLEKYVATVMDGSGGNVLTARKPCLAALFSEAVGQLHDSAVVELWTVVKSLSEIEMSGAAVDGRFSTNVQSAMIDRSLQLLQTEHLDRVRQLVYSNLRGARLGGVPGIRQLMQSFLSLHPVSTAVNDSRSLFADETGSAVTAVCDGVAGWPLVYNCLRCGDRQAARDAAAACQPPLLDVVGWLDEMAHSGDGRVSSASQSAIRLQYRRSVASAGAGCYRRAVLAVLGAGGDALVSDDHSDVTTTTDDFLWLKLSCIRTLTLDARSDALTSLQTKLLEEYGETHFDAYNQPLLYFRVLFLTGQLEAAVEFLSRIDKFRCHALHIALCLQECTLLQLSDSGQAPLLSRATSFPSPRRHLNLVRLALMYTRRFEASEPQVVLQYLFVLRHLQAVVRGGDDEDMITTAVVELILESGKYEQLVGRVAADGERVPGVLDRYIADGGGVSDLVERVAAACEQRGLLEDAVQLYDVAGNHERMLQLLNALLSQLAPQAAPPVTSSQSQRQRLQTAAVAIARRFKEKGHNARQARVDTLFLLLDVMAFFDLYHSSRHEEALSVMLRLRLLSLSSGDLQSRLDDFTRLDDEVRRCIGDLLLATMSCLQLMAAAASSRAVLSELRQQARALLTFAGSVPYRLAGDTHARLTRMETLMN